MWEHLTVVVFMVVEFPYHNIEGMDYVASLQAFNIAVSIAVIVVGADAGVY